MPGGQTERHGGCLMARQSGKEGCVTAHQVHGQVDGATARLLDLLPFHQSCSLLKPYPTHRL